MWLILLASFVPHDTTIYDRVDVTEVNRVFDERGCETLVQVVWWDWSWWDEEYRVVAWRLIKDTGYPQREGDRFVTRWFDRQGHSLRHVESKVFRETMTLYDVDLADRNILPEDARRGLTNRPIHEKQLTY